MIPECMTQWSHFNARHDKPASMPHSIAILDVAGGKGLHQSAGMVGIRLKDHLIDLQKSQHVIG